MSLIPCPECGKQISDSVQHCIHCGSPLTLCPECKNVLPPKAENCPHCGYAIVASTNKPNPTSVEKKSLERTAETKTTCEALYNEWAKDPSTKKILANRGLRWIFTGFSIFFYLIGFVMLFSAFKKLNNMNDYQRALELVALKSKLHTAVIIVIIGSVIAMCDTIFSTCQDLYNHLSLSKWLPNCKKDYKNAIFQDLTIKSDWHTGKAEILAVASWLHDNVQRKQIRICTAVINCILQSIALIIVSILLLQFPDFLLLSSQGVNTTAFWKKILVILVIVVIPMLIGTILDGIFKSAGKNWVKNYYKEQENK